MPCAHDDIARRAYARCAATRRKNDDEEEEEEEEKEEEEKTEEEAPLPFARPNQGERAVVDELVKAVGDKRLLVVVDNCEHVLAASAAVIERIIADCPKVVVLATSREPLMISGERLRPVPSMPAPDAETLLLERAAAEAPDLIIDSLRRALTLVLGHYDTRSMTKIVAGAVIAQGECGEDDITSVNLDQMADTLASRAPTVDERRELVEMLRWIAALVRGIEESAPEQASSTPS